MRGREKKNVADKKKKSAFTANGILSNKEKKKKGPKYTLPTKPVEETKSCKDCQAYNQAQCSTLGKFVPRKGTCKKWNIKRTLRKKG